MVRVAWHVFVEAKDGPKSIKLIEQIGAALRMPIEVVSCERYWKDERLFDCRFTTALDATPGDPAGVVYQVLVHARALTGWWRVRCPDDEPGLEFAGIAHEGFRQSWLEWAMFEGVATDDASTSSAAEGG